MKVRPPNFCSSTSITFLVSVSIKFDQTFNIKVVGLWINFPTHQESTHSDFSTKSYDKNTKACSHVCFLRNLCWLATCSSIFSMKETDSDKVFFIRVVALSLSFPMVCGSYFSDFSTESYSKNTEGYQDELMLRSGCCVGQFWPICHWIWILSCHEHCSPMS